MQNYLKSIAAAVFVAAFAWWVLDSYEFLRAIRFYTFQVRDLERARELLRGNGIFFGPEMTGGGHLPGSLYYWLLAGALFLKDEWQSAALLLLGLNAAAAALGWHYFRKKISLPAATAWLGLFLLSTPMENVSASFLNVSFLLPFLLGAMICLREAFPGAPEAARPKPFVAALFLLGLAAQVHLSSVFLVFAITVMQVLGPRIGVCRRQSARTIALGVLAFLAPMLPYLAWLVLARLGQPFGQTTQFAGDPQVAPVSLAAYVDLPPPGRALDVAYNLFLRVPLPLPILLLATAVQCAREKGPRERLPRGGPGEFAFLACTVAGFLPALYLLVAPIGSRYSFAFSLAAILLTVALFGRLKDRAALFLLSFLCLVICLAFASWTLLYTSKEIAESFVHSRNWILTLALIAFLFFSSRKERAGNGRGIAAALMLSLAFLQNPARPLSGLLYTRAVLAPSVAEWEGVAAKASVETSWAPSEIVDHLYVVNGHMELDPRPIFNGIENSPGEQKPENPPSGYFVNYYKQLAGTPFPLWLSRQQVAEEIKTGLREGTLRLGKPERVGNLLVVPYFVDRSAKLPPVFHNIGNGYVPSPAQAFLRESGRLGQAVKLANGKFLMRWNDCPGREPYCDTGALVKVRKSGSKFVVEISVLGDSLGQSSPWITPTRNLSWNAPYLEVACGSRKQRFELATSIGYNRRLGYLYPLYDFYLSNHSLLAPFTREYELGCSPTQITVGTESATIDLIRSAIQLPGQKLSVAL